MGNKYEELRDIHKRNYDKISKGHRGLGILRLVGFALFVFCIYKLIATSNFIYIWAAVASLIYIIMLIIIHNKLLWRRRLEKNIININEDELDYLNKESIPFYDGNEFMDTKHIYSYDLDIFGKGSIYHNINRTSTYIGSLKLADKLLSTPSKEEILERQYAVKDLSSKIEWRQKIRGLGILGNDNRDAYESLISWVNTEEHKLPKALVAASYVMPMLFLLSLMLYAFTPISYMINITIILFLVNLGILYSSMSRITKLIVDSDNIYNIVRHYGLILQEIEKISFDSPLLKAHQGNLSFNNALSSKHIKTLSKLFSSLESVNNLLGAFIFNGISLYHIHIVRNIISWKNSNAKYIKNWMDILGEIDALSSISNFAYNNPKFVYPSLNNNYYINFKHLGHPLISEDKRVCNDILFSRDSFIILTGSNMSGKSTFLRTIGVNMIMANVGSPICAEDADIHPMPILVSMRLNDSLSDSESYFFAEVKRLKEISEIMKSDKCFILLDEILRGTNSEDKRNGTIGFIHKLIENKVMGIIATHDLEVCRITDTYPDILENKYFDSQIRENELFFDYKLREGICFSKSASFLMKKMDII